MSNILRTAFLGACYLYLLFLWGQWLWRKESWGQRQSETVIFALFDVRRCCLWSSAVANIFFFFYFMVMKMKYYFTLKALFLKWDFNQSAFVQKLPNLEMNKRFDSWKLISSGVLFSCIPPYCLLLYEQVKQGMVIIITLIMWSSESQITEYIYILFGRA